MNDLMKVLVRPGTWLIALIIIESIFIVVLYKHLGTNSSFSIKRLAGCILLSIVLAVVTFVAIIFLYGNAYKESKVDVSPIAELSIEQVDRLEEVINQFSELEFIVNFTISEQKGANPYLDRMYEFLWSSKDPISSLVTYVRFFKAEDRAVADFQSMVDSREERQAGGYKHIVNGNNTEALLPDSRMITSAEELYFPNTERQISGSVRLGNAIVSFSEVLQFYDLDKNISSDFIRLLCDMLKVEG